jgi:hypothetical protein
MPKIDRDEISSGQRPAAVVDPWLFIDLDNLDARTVKVAS